MNIFKLMLMSGCLLIATSGFAALSETGTTDSTTSGGANDTTQIKITDKDLELLDKVSGDSVKKLGNALAMGGRIGDSSSYGDADKVLQAMQGGTGASVSGSFKNLAFGSSPAALTQTMASEVQSALPEIIGTITPGIPTNGNIVDKREEEAKTTTEEGKLDSQQIQETEKTLHTQGTDDKQVETSEVSGTDPTADQCPAEMSNYPTVSNAAFDYINEHILKKYSTSDEYAPMKKSVDEAKSFVENKYYIHWNDQTCTFDKTDENVRKVSKLRRQYWLNTNAELVAISNGVRSKLVEDAESISAAATSGCEVYEDIDTNTLIMIAVARQTMAALILDLKALELQVAVEQVQQPLELLSQDQSESCKRATPSN